MIPRALAALSKICRTGNDLNYKVHLPATVFWPLPHLRKVRDPSDPLAGWRASPSWSSPHEEKMDLE